MKWIDGNEIDMKQFSGERLCEKLALEMWDHREHWSECDEFIQNALFIIDFDTVTNMEGFSTPYDGYFTSEEYLGIIKHFKLSGIIMMLIFSQKRSVSIHITKGCLTVQKMKTNPMKSMTNSVRSLMI